MFVLLYWKDTEIYGQKALEIYENLDKVSEHPECYPLKALHMKFNDFELELWQLFLGGNFSHQFYWTHEIE